MPRKWVFSGLFQGFSKVAGAAARAGAGARARTSRTALKICYKSFSEYLGILIAVAGDFGPNGLLGYLENSDLGGREKLGGATGKKRAIERRFRRGQLQLYTEVILVLIFF